MPRTRRLLQVRVGNDRVVDVIVNLRRVDISWFDDDKLSTLLSVLQEEIIPRVDQSKFDIALGPQGIPISTANNNNNNNKKKKRRNPKKLPKPPLTEEERPAPTDKEVLYASHEELQMIYQCQHVSAGVTLARENTTNFTELKKFPHRIVLWCYPKWIELPVDEGFPRPETIGIADLFRNTHD